MTAVRGHVRVIVDPTRSLRYAPVEAAMVAASLAGRDVEVLGPESVTEEGAEQAARSADILHVVGHGTFTDASPYRSAMYLSPAAGSDGLWIVADVLAKVDAPAGRLAVLSGCETGRVRPNIVSEDISLPSAFLAAGFAAVVASRWAVDDLSTSLLMADLYARWLQGGITIARALAESTDWLRQLERDTAAILVAGLPSAVGAPAHPAGTAVEYVDAAAALRAGAPFPFEQPEHWAAFYVAGDGAITAGGADPRIPSAGGTRSRAIRGRPRTTSISAA
jgi:CHAT domain-containing protein